MILGAVLKNTDFDRKMHIAQVCRFRRSDCIQKPPSFLQISFFFLSLQMNGKLRLGYSSGGEKMASSLNIAPPDDLGNRT